MNILDLADPEFNGLMSSDEIWYAGESNVRLTAVVEHKSDYDHTHEGYASQDDLDLLEDVVANKANTTHNHSEYAPVSHVHTNYATTEALAGKANSSHTHSNYVNTTTFNAFINEVTAVAGAKADANHTHSEYAPASHEHDEYATVEALDTLELAVNNKANASHSHTGYASTSHSHDEYAATSHDHDEDYSPISHSHSNYATVSALNEVSSAVGNKANASHTHTGVYDASGAAANALTSANAYTDSKIDALVGEGASTTLDTIGEISSAIEDNQDAIDLLNSAIANKANTSHTHDDRYYTETEVNNLLSGKANSSHTHTIANVSGLQSALDGKAASSHGTHVSYSTTAPVMDGTASVGTASTVARSDHKHPTDTSRAAQADLDALETVVAGKAASSHTHTIANITNLQTTLDAKAASSHTHSAATTSAAGLMSAADKSKLDGIASGANAYSLPTAGSSLGGVKTTSTVTSASGYTACPIIGGVPYYKDTNTTYSLSSFGITATAAELNALDGITATVTELNYMDGVTSNVQTQLNGKAASSHTHNYAGSSSAGGAATSANKLNTNAGSATQPVYFANGVPVKTTYTLGASVPSGAKFTDTTYSAVTTSANGLMIASDKSKLDGMVLATVAEVETYLGI